MAKTRKKDQQKDTKSGATARRNGPPAKVAVTLRLDAERVGRMQALAAAENRTLTNYVETALIRDLSLRDEAARVIAMLAAPGTSAKIGLDEVLCGAEESNAAFDRRRSLIVDLWSIPDSE